MATELRQRTSSDGGSAEDSVVRICVVFDDYCGSREVFGSWAREGCRCRGFNVIDRDPRRSLPYIGAFIDAYQIQDRRIFGDFDETIGASSWVVGVAGYCRVRECRGSW